MSLFHPIHHTFAPLADSRQVWRSLGMLLAPWRYRRGESVIHVKQKLENRFNGNAFLFASGREALLALLQSLKLTPGEEVVVQAYTCVIVPNAIQAARMVPIYADIDRDLLNIDLASLQEKLTPRTRVVLCQHTFGIPAPMKELRAFCDRHSLILIEDCAHILPDHTGPSEIGILGDFLLLSFGRDKAVSGVAGGAIICRKPEVGIGLDQRERSARPLSHIRIARLLCYPLIYAIARPLIGLGIGKAWLLLQRVLGLLLPIVTPEEKEGRMPKELHALPNACAFLALDQLQRLELINEHRRMLTRLYIDAFRQHQRPILQGIRSDLPLQKFPFFAKNAEKIRRTLKKKNIHLHDGWTGCVVCPAGVDLPASGYTLGEDPQAEAVCEEILSLPTHPGMTIGQAQRLVEEMEPLMRN